MEARESRRRVHGSQMGGADMGNFVVGDMRLKYLGRMRTVDGVV